VVKDKGKERNKKRKTKDRHELHEFTLRLKTKDKSAYSRKAAENAKKNKNVSKRQRKRSKKLEARSKKIYPVILSKKSLSLCVLVPLREDLGFTSFL
jgi:hypothetical protein